METVILMVYLATWSTGGGMASFSQEFATKEACQAAGKLTVKRFGGMYTRVFWTCAGRATGEEKANGQS